MGGGGNFVQFASLRVSLNLIQDQAVFDQNSSIKAMQIIAE